MHRIKSFFLSIHDTVRDWPWWLVVLIVLGGGWLIGGIADGYLWRTVGAVGKACIALVIGYWAHRHIIMQGRRIGRDEQGPDARMARISRAIIIAAFVIAVAIAP